MATECCAYIEFKIDSEPEDLTGEFRAHGFGYEVNGIFELNILKNTVHLDYEDTQKLYEFQILNDVISFTYSENDQEIIEDWRKEE